MKLASRIFNILVFLVAVGAAVCAYMLFNKREQITKGNQMMSAAVVKAVKDIDPATKIKADEMSVKHPAVALKTPLTTLDKTVNKIVDQRDGIASTLAETTNKVISLDAELGQTAEQMDYKAIADYKTSVDKRKEASDLVNSRIDYLGARNTAMKDGLRSVIAAAKSAEISDEDIKNNDKVTESFSATAKAVETHVVKKEKYASNITAIAQIVEAPVTIEDTMSEEALDAELKKASDGAEKLLADRNEQKAQREKLAAEVITLKKDLEDKEKALAKLETQTKTDALAIKKYKREIAKLKKIIDPTGGETTVASAADKQPAANPALQYSKLAGKVTFVNDDFGFVIIDLGTKNKVSVPDKDGKPVEQIIPLPDDALMTVVTSLDPEKARYVARLQVVKVGENKAVANVIPGLVRQMPKAGDAVFFTSADINQVVAKRAEAMKAKMDAELKAQAAAKAEAKATEDEMKDESADAEDSKSEEDESAAPAGDDVASTEE